MAAAKKQIPAVGPFNVTRKVSGSKLILEIDLAAPGRVNQQGNRTIATAGKSSPVPGDESGKMYFNCSVWEYTS